MISQSRFIELLAREASESATAEDRAQLDAACSASAALRLQRDEFLAAITAARSDDTIDAPGPTLMRAYAIHTQADQTQPASARVSLLQIVFDSLRPAAGLRSGATADRQLMLEADGITADVFIRGTGATREIRVMLEGHAADSATVHLVGDEGAADFDQDADAWTTRVALGRARIEIHAAGQVLMTDELEIG